jgi:putative transposase
LKEESVWQHLFENFEHARREIRNWMRWYNEERPHQSLDYLSPTEYRAQQLQAVA